MQKNKHYFKGPLWAYGLPAIALAAFILFTACPQEGDDDDTPPVAPTLVKVINHLVISSDSSADDPAPYLEFVFDGDVSGPAVSSVTIGEGDDATSDAVENWAAALKKGENDVVVATTVTVTYTAPGSGTAVAAGDKLAITLTASGSPVEVTLRAVGELFDRDSLDAGDGYRISGHSIDSYSAAIGLASLDANDDETVVWVALDLDDDAAVIKTFEAILGPNRTETAKTVETGKTAITFTEAISKAAIKLFKVKFATDDDGNPADTVEIKGTTLPTAAGADAENLIVIDIGLPDADADNSELPTFYIPYGELGAESETGDYSHIRFRVNKGATLVLLADNDGYIENGPGDPNETGNFHGGTVEVLDGGYLRDGAYEGFPLGDNAVILNRSGSYLAIGPEPGSPDATADAVKDAYDAYYAGWLLGPAPTETITADNLIKQPKIVWDADNSESSYLEVRPGEIATDAKLTLKRSIGLIYSVWFVDDAALTIDILNADKSATYFPAGAAEGSRSYGLASNPRDASSPFEWTFYSAYKAGPPETTTQITIKSGSSLDKRFLIASQTASGNGIFLATDLAEAASDPSKIFVTATDEDIVIKGVKLTSAGDGVEYSVDTGIKGYPAWLKPE
jgi:hypothetical protein